MTERRVCAWLFSPMRLIGFAPFVIPPIQGTKLAVVSPDLNDENRLISTITSYHLLQGNFIEWRKVMRDSHSSVHTPRSRHVSNWHSLCLVPAELIHIYQICYGTDVYDVRSIP